MPVRKSRLPKRWSDKTKSDHKQHAHDSSEIFKRSDGESSFFSFGSKKVSNCASGFKSWSNHVAWFWVVFNLAVAQNPYSEILCSEVSCIQMHLPWGGHWTCKLGIRTGTATLPISQRQCFWNSCLYDILFVEKKNDRVVRALYLAYAFSSHQLVRLEELLFNEKVTTWSSWTVSLLF